MDLPTEETKENVSIHTTSKQILLYLAQCDLIRTEANNKTVYY